MRITITNVEPQDAQLISRYVESTRCGSYPCCYADHTVEFDIPFNIGPDEFDNLYRYLAEVIQLESQIEPYMTVTILDASQSLYEELQTEWVHGLKYLESEQEVWLYVPFEVNLSAQSTLLNLLREHRLVDNLDE